MQLAGLGGARALAGMRNVSSVLLLFLALTAGAKPILEGKPSPISEADIAGAPRSATTHSTEFPRWDARALQPRTIPAAFGLAVARRCEAPLLPKHRREDRWQAFPNTDTRSTMRSRPQEIFLAY